MAAVALAFGASLMFGLTDFVAGIMSKRLGALTVLFVAQMSTVVLLAVVAPIAGVEVPSATFLGYAAASGLAQIIGISAFWQAMTVGAMGVVAPISATGAVVPVVIGLINGERPGTLQAAGIAAAFVGVVMVSYDPRLDADGGRRLSKGVGLALVAAFGVGLLFTTLDAAASRGTLLSALVINRAVSASILCATVLIVRRRISLRRGDLKLLVAIGVMEIAGLFMFSAATTFGLLSIVGVVAALYPVYTIALARVFLRERLALSQRVGAMASISGVAAIAAG